MRALLTLVGALALAGVTVRAETKMNPDVQKLTTYKVVGYVDNFNAKYVLLKAKKKFRIVPRHTLENPNDIRPGRLAVARLTVKDILSVQKFQKSRRLPL